MFLPKTAFSKSNHFGISISDASVRAISLDTQGNITYRQELEVQKAWIMGDDVDLQSLIQGLKQVITQEIPNTYAAVCIPEKYAYSRVHTFLNITLAEVPEALNWQLEKIFPFDQKEIYADWKLISQDQSGITVLVTVIPKKLLDGLKNAVQAAGIFPISFEPSASALTRLVDTSTHPQIILELRNHSTSATLVINGISSLTTTTTFSEQSSPQEILDQINFSIQSLQNHLQSNHITTQDLKLVASGEKATPELLAVLQEQLKLPIHLLEVNDLEPRYHLAFIAAKANIFPPESHQSINLLPTSLQNYYHAHTNYTLAHSVLKYVIAISLVSALVSGAAFAGIEFMIKQANTTKSKLQNNATSVETSQFNLALVNQAANRVVTLFPVKKSPESVITTIFNTVPEGIRINNLQVNSVKQQYDLIGVAPSREALLQLKQSLEKTDMFTKISLPLTTLEIEQSINFNLVFSQKPINP
jgi:hypothetical protein